MAVVEQGECLRVAVADEGDQVLVGEERVASCVVSHTVRPGLLIWRVEAPRSLF
jgi:hypothetical protein